LLLPLLLPEVLLPEPAEPVAPVEPEDPVLPVEPLILPLAPVELLPLGLDVVEPAVPAASVELLVEPDTEPVADDGLLDEELLAPEVPIVPVALPPALVPAAAPPVVEAFVESLPDALILTSVPARPAMLVLPTLIPLEEMLISGVN